MKLYTVLLLAWAAFVSAASLPSCASTCVARAIKKTGCAARNTQCVCSSEHYMGYLKYCFARKCGSLDQADAIESATAVCNIVLSDGVSELSSDESMRVQKREALPWGNHEKSSTSSSSTHTSTKSTKTSTTKGHTTKTSTTKGHTTKTSTTKGHTTKTSTTKGHTTKTSTSKGQTTKTSTTKGHTTKTSTTKGQSTNTPTNKGHSNTPTTKSTPKPTTVSTNTKKTWYSKTTIATVI